MAKKMTPGNTRRGKRPTFQKSKVGKKVKRGKSPPSWRGWRNRKHPRGWKARKIVAGIKSKLTKIEVKTAIQLARDEEMNETDFVNFVQSLGLSGHEAYTLFFSPP